MMIPLCHIYQHHLSVEEKKKMNLFTSVRNLSAQELSDLLLNCHYEVRAVTL